MKVVLFNGSPKAKGNTYHALKIVEDKLIEEGIETKIVHVGNSLIRGCMACNQCMKNRDEKCVIKGDDVNEWIQDMKEADGIVISSPVHFASIAGTMKSFLDRAFYVTGMNKSMLRHKVGAAVVVVRRSGGVPTLNQLNNYLNYSEMMMPTSNYWHVAHGTSPGEVTNDAEGVQIMNVLASNMAYLLKLKNNEQVPAPAPEKKVYTSFIR